MIGFNDHEWMLLNESTNSQIYSLLDRNFLKSSAIKVIPHVNSCVHKKECSHLKNEFDILSTIDHKNIVKPYEFMTSNQSCAMTTELAISDYSFFINKNKNYLKLNVVRDHFKQIAQALHHLHKMDIAHNDIKLENFLYFGNKILKISDFGFSIICK